VRAVKVIADAWRAPSAVAARVRRYGGTCGRFSDFRSVATVASSELEKSPVRTPDPHDEPSVEWGWHGTLPNSALVGGILVAILMFGMFIGNQIGHVEDFYLGGTGLIFIVLALRGIGRRRRAWRR
jgi:hypothetical protein